MKLIIFTIFLLLLLPVVLAMAAPLENIPQRLIQPNGDTLHCFASGDEFYNFLHDEDGYVIIQDPVTGFYVYADKVNGKIIPTIYVAEKEEPETLGLKKQIMLPTEEYHQRREQYGDAYGVSSTPHTGTIEQIIIFIRFSDEEAVFALPRSTWDTRFNSSAAGVSSVLNYYREASFNKLDIFASFYPTTATNVNLSFQDTLPRAYYQPYNSVSNPDGYKSESSRKTREHRLLRGAVAAIESAVPAALDIDADNDNRVDLINFVISGSPDGWSELLWPHKWTLDTYTVKLNGERVYTYALMLETTFNIGTMCHETFHSLGAPDLYHYTSGLGYLRPVWSWGLMEKQGDPPHHMLSHLKQKYGKWITVPVIDTAGYYTLNPATSEFGQAYRFGVGSSINDKHFVIEYRQKTGTFESTIPDSGLIIYRVYPMYNGNADGPPDEVYIYRPGGALNAQGTPDEADFSADEGKFRCNNLTDPAITDLYYDNADQFIADIGLARSTIEFFFTPDFSAYNTYVQGYWNSNLSSNPDVYWLQSSAYATSPLSIASGTRVYGEPLSKLSSTASDGITVLEGSLWTRILTLGNYRAGIRSKGTIKMTNGGEIRFR